MDALYNNSLLNQGCTDRNGSFKVRPWCGVLRGEIPEKAGFINVSAAWPHPLQGICERAYAIEAMQFVTLGLSLSLLVLGFLMLKRKGEKFSLKS